MSSLIFNCGIDTGSGCVASSITYDYQIETTRRYKVIADPTADETYVRANFGLGLTPPIGLYKSHPVETYTRCKRVDASFDSKLNWWNYVTLTDVPACQWIVNASFGVVPLNQIFENGVTGDPTDAQLEVSIEGVEQQRICDQDANGYSVANSAGVPYDPPVYRDDMRAVLKITRNEKLLSPALILSYANKLNLNPFQGMPSGYWKMAVPIITPKYSPFLNVLYYRVQYTIEYNPDSWKEIILDAGYQWFDTSTNKLRNILDAQGLNVTSPGLLDGHGKPLKLPAAKSDLVWNSHDKYFTADFDPLNFPPNIFVTVPFL